MTRVAVVDIGSNSTRLYVADIDGGKIIAELERESEVTRLGQRVDTTGRLATEAMERTTTTLARYAERIERHQPDRRIAVLTSATRDAANGGEFAAAVENRFHLTPHILTGDDEARLTFLGATSERDPRDRTTTLVIDIGGGSTELVIGHGREMTFHVSTQAGVVRQTERHIDHDPPHEDEMRAVAADVRRTIDDALSVARGEECRGGGRGEECRGGGRGEERAGGGRGAAAEPERGIAVAGTATSLGAIAQRLEPYDPAKVHGYHLTKTEIAGILDELKVLPLAQRREVPGLHPDRAPTIIAGVIILREVLSLFGLDGVEVSEHDILRGAALGLA